VRGASRSPGISTVIDLVPVADAVVVGVGVVRRRVVHVFLVSVVKAVPIAIDGAPTAPVATAEGIAPVIDLRPVPGPVAVGVPSGGIGAVDVSLVGIVQSVAVSIRLGASRNRPAMSEETAKQSTRK
jgi:hypothetical protein